MKPSTKRTMKRNAGSRLRVAMAILLALTLSPLVGGLAFATGSTGAGVGDSEGSATSASSSGIAAAIADGTSSIADPDTIWDWEGLIKGNTANVGRIWTDKSVTTDSMTNNNITVTKADGSAFLTALTALSSTSNLSSTATTPLDIVLVLDTSSSMTQGISTSTGTTTRIQALKDAANSFVDVIANKNTDISDEAKQHRVAVVSFNDKASTNQGMTVCAGDKATEIKSAITALGTDQGTHSDYGLQQAQKVLTSSKRDGAKQVVVFFTDGIPTVSGADNFDPAIASPAVTAAGQMKDAGNGATVYTIGIHNYADPSADPKADSTHVLNKFLHAVSSNYPAATYTASGSTYDWSFGDRAKKADGTTDADFYKSATSADKLKEIFEDISQEITKNAGYPTHTTDGYESTSGYITFNDQLGDYMEVTDLSTLIYDAEKYTCESKTTKGNVDTYHFSGKVNSGIGEGNLSDIIVTVTRSESVAAGDKVEVKIPATLIPLRHFEVDEDAGTMTVTDKTPITVFYSSALKSEVADLLVNPDDDMAAYIAKNTDKTTGKVNFYANKWNGGTLGDVTSQFDPSSGNSYYYITQDTPIFKDEDCTTRASQIVDGETYYYQHAYYVLVDGGPKAKKITERLAFPGSAAAAFEGCIGNDGDGCYFKAGTARLVYINQLHKEKTDDQGKSTNYTGTATDVLNPKWNSETSVAEATTVTPHLGNNGKLMLDKPSTLKVSKAITVPDGYNAEDYANAEFTFELNVPKAAGYSFPAVVLDANGQATCDEFSLTFDASGKATHTIKPGETLQVSGLGADWNYTVTETKMPAGFTQTAPADAAGKAIAATGTFAAGQTAQASFTNTYAADPVTYNAATDLGVYKQLAGRGWMDADAFAFELKALTDGAPMPQGAQEGVATATVTKRDVAADGHAPVSFGDIVYTKAGTYKYQVKEVNAGQTIAGVTYADNVATFTVKVTDLDKDGNHTGKLVAKATLDSGAVAFENTYEPTNASCDTADAGLNKVLTGRDWLTSDTFAFTIEAKTAGAPLPQDSQGNVVTEVDVTKDNAANFGFGTITFTQDMIADAPNRTKVFEYVVTEVIPADADKIPGVSYDTHAATIKVTVTDNGLGKLTATSAVENVTFTNAYQTSLSYTGAGGLNVAKTLTGHDMAEGQFTINVVPDDAAAAAALGIPEEGIALAMPAAADGAQATRNVLAGRNVTFTQDDAGKTFGYKVSEVVGTLGGYTYDKAERTVTIAVTDDPEKAALTATTTVAGGPEGTKVFTYTKDGAVGAAAVVPFANTYFASTDVPGGVAATVNATKTLTGRDMVAGEFSFGVRLAGAKADVLTATNAADGTVAFGKLSYTTDTLAALVADGHATKATAADGKATWTIGYVAYENTEGLADVGVTAQTQPIAFTVTVVDNGDGTLTATANMPEGGLTFANTYATGGPAKVALAGVKVLQHDEDLVPDSIAGKFTFTVSSADPAAPLPRDAQGALATTATNDANGNVTFGDITFTLDDLNRALGDAGKKTEEKAQVATEAAAGETAAEPAAETAVEAAAGGATEAVVEATEAADGATGALTVAGNAAKANAEVAAEPATEAAGEAEPAADKADKAAAPQARSYTFVYTVTESGTVAGVTNDATAKTVSVKVTDDGVGNLTAAVVGEAGKPAFAFTNTYGVTPVTSSVTDQIDVTKTLTGRDMVAGEFTFELLDGDTVVAEGTNDADGAVAFDPVTYTKPATYHYTVREAGAGTTVDGVTYDGATFAVTTVVADDGKGGLTVTHKLADGESIAFANAYAAEPTSVVIGAAKVLEGKDLVDGQFTFKLTGADGTELEASNAADGTVTFPAITFDKVGTYTYIVAEVDDEQANVTYDGATYEVTVTVTDDGKGHLAAKVTGGEDGAMVFRNVYAEPTPDPEPTPKVTPTPDTGQKATPKATTATKAKTTTVKTGDTVFALALATGLLLAALAGMAIAVAAARKRW